VSAITGGGRALAVAALLGVVALWSSTFVATKLLFGQAGPTQIALLRFVVASAILLPIARESAVGVRLPLGRLALLGLTGVTGYFTFQNVGLVYTSASAAALILACLPALVAGVAALMLGERLSRRRAVGVGASVLGVTLIVLAGEPGATAPAPLLGNGLILLAAASWTAYTILGKGAEGLPVRVVSAGGVAFGAVFLVPFAVVETIATGPPRLDLAGWLGILYLGAGASAAAFFLWSYALRRMEASEAAVYLNLIPLLAVVLAAVALQEEVGVAEVVGGALVIGGVIMASRAAALPTVQSVRQPSGDDQQSSGSLPHRHSERQRGIRGPAVAALGDAAQETDSSLRSE
jgi:drug/metabolite transporter (DMT)-like permease